MRRCVHCGGRVILAVTHAVGGWGVERCCEGCGPLETLTRGWPSREMAEDELLEVAAIETGQSKEALRRLYQARKGR